jgi:hypothetical protein
VPRHKTLRAVVDWSWELLTDAERMVLRRLSVFSGGASLEAAEQVCVGADVEQDEVLELLTSLAEKSLLVTEGDGAPRYRMLGTIKEYAADRLAEAGNRTWPGRRISPTSPSSPRPRSHICAAPSNWNGSPRSRPNTTTSVPRCRGRSRPVTRRRRCGSRRPPVGTGGSAGAGGKASR